MNKHFQKRYTVVAALPYSNGNLHVGHIAGAYLPCDIFARYLRLNGANVCTVSGSDDYGVAITMTAEKEGRTPQETADHYNANQKRDFESLGINFDIYGSTSRNKFHAKTSQDLFLSLYNKGHFEKIETNQLYDTQRNLFLADRYVKGKCGYCDAEEQNGDQCENCGKQLDVETLKNPISTLSNTPAILKKTTHWFLDLSKSESVVEKWLETAEVKENTRKFVRGLLSTGLVKRSMTRDISWGIPVPLDDPEAKNKVLYVWFDAPIGYISNTKELCEAKFGDPEKYTDWWKSEDCKIYHFIGEDNTIFHAVIWIAMLHTEGSFQLPTGVMVNNFLNIKFPDREIEKISKSRGSAIWIDNFIQHGGDPDGLRYYLTMIAPEQARTVYNPMDYVVRYNSELGNVLGNLVSRVVSMVNKNFDGSIIGVNPDNLDESTKKIFNLLTETKLSAARSIESFGFKGALEMIMALCRECNKYFDEKAPWKLVKTDRENAHVVLSAVVNLIKDIAILLEPFLPFTSRKICKILNTDVQILYWDNIGISLPDMQIGESEILFPKIEIGEGE